MLRLVTTAGISLATLLLASNHAHAMTKTNAETFLGNAISLVSTNFYGGQPFVSADSFPVVPQIVVDPSRSVNATQDLAFANGGLAVGLNVNQGLLDIKDDNVVKLALCHELGHIFSGPVLDRHNLSHQGPRTEIAADLGAAYLLELSGVSWSDVVTAANRGTTDNIFDPSWAGDHPPGSKRAMYINLLATLMQSGAPFDVAAAAVLLSADLEQQPATWQWASVYTQATGGPAPQNNDYKTAVFGVRPAVQSLRGDDVLRFAEYGRRIAAIRAISPSTLVGKAVHIGPQELTIAQQATTGLTIDVSPAKSAVSGTVANLSVNELQRTIRPPVLDFMVCHLIGHAVAQQFAQTTKNLPATFVEIYADSLAVRLLAAMGHSKSTLSESEILDQIQSVLSTWEPADDLHPAPATRRTRIADAVNRLP